MTRKKKAPKYEIVITTNKDQQSQEDLGRSLKSLGEQMRSLSGVLFESVKFQADQLQEFSKTFAETFKIIISNWQIDLQPQLRQIAQSLQKVVEPVQEDAKLAAPLLAKARFWITPSMSLVLLRRIREIAEKEGSTPENVETVIIEYYEQDNWLKLKRTVEAWRGDNLFAKRMFIIGDALDAHILGKYTLSIPTLIPQIEGLLSSINKSPAGDPTFIFKNTIEKEYTTFLSNVSRDILLELATSPVLYGGVSESYFNTERFSYWLEQKGLMEEQLFNRAAILHGVQINYATKANSLRVFLLLDIVYWITRKKI